MQANPAEAAAVCEHISTVDLARILFARVTSSGRQRVLLEGQDGQLRSADVTLFRASPDELRRFDRGES